MIYLTRSLVESIVTKVYPYRRTYKDLSPKIGTTECQSIDAKAGISYILKWEIN